MTENRAMLDLVALAKQRGAAPTLLSLLDALEPAAPILAQTLLVAQPLANLFRAGDACRELADLLDEPNGAQELRDLLAEEPIE